MYSVSDNKFIIGMAGEKEVVLYPKMANRHGLIAGATGTGKTVTLKVLAESFSSMGVPVFMADVKGDLAATCIPGEASGKVAENVAKYNLEDKGFEYRGFPVTYWDVLQKRGIPLRATISEIGPTLLANMLSLTEVQKEVLTVLFKIADDQGLLLIDTKDLKAFIQEVADNLEELRLEYGAMSKQSLSGIVRDIVALEAEGGDKFFFEPALKISSFLQKSIDGQGNINILDCQELINKPNMYSAFMMWLMTELFQELPEYGDQPKPRMVFFFDEAHLLFDKADKDLLEKIGQVIKLIRSKGVGIYFITQNPKDVPDEILAQLGLRIQHALHAYTPAEQKSVKAAAESFRVNPEFDTFEAIQSLEIGEALVSVLDEQGVPTVVERTAILPPQSKMGAIDDATRQQMINASDFYLEYKDEIDRESAYEILTKKAEESAAAAEQAAKEAAEQKEAEKQAAAEAKAAEKEAAAAARAEAKAQADAQKKAEREAEKNKKAVKSAASSVAKTTAGTVGREVGKSLGKSVGGNFGKTLGGNVGASIARGIIGSLFK